MQIPIYKNNLVVTLVKPNDSSELLQKKQTEDVVRLDFTLDDYIPIELGSYIILEKTKQKYYINKVPKCIESPRLYRYECIFEGLLHEFSKIVCLFETITPEQTYTDYRFPLTGTAETFLRYIVSLVNKYLREPITVGVFEQTQSITLNFEKWTVTEALAEISKNFSIDWYLEGTVLNFAKPSIYKAYTFQVGRKAGLLELTRFRTEDDLFATVVYGVGGKMNLPPRTNTIGPTFNGTILHENRLTFSGIGGQSYLTKNTNLYGNVVKVVEFDEIYPKRNGQVISLSQSIRSFYDTGIEFNINEQLLPGITPKITFTTGALIGLTFNISWDDTNKLMTLDYYSDESGQYPNDIIFPEVGDTYKLFDIIMPQQYIIDAQNELQEAAQKYLDDNSSPKTYFEAEIDPEFVESKNIDLMLGDIVRIISTTFGIDNYYEIKELTQSITDKNKYQIRFGDILPKNLLLYIKSTNFAQDQQTLVVQRNSMTYNQVNNIIGENITWEQIE